MPVIPLEKNSPFNVFRVMAVMAYPNDESSCNNFMASIVSKTAIEAGEDVPLSFVKILLEAPSFENITNDFTKKGKYGCIAGDVLLYIFRLKKIGAVPSVRKAMFILRESYKASDGIGIDKARRTPLNEISFRKYWNEFKPVAHFWAAFRVFETMRERDSECPIPFDTENLSLFLAHTEFFRNFGESNMAERVHMPTLNPDETWRVPDDYPLPSASVDVSETDRWLKDTMKDYVVGTSY